MKTDPGHHARRPARGDRRRRVPSSPTTSPTSTRRSSRHGLYALEVHAGARPGPYTDARAERYADRAIALRTSATRRGRRRDAHRSAHGLKSGPNESRERAPAKPRVRTPGSPVCAPPCPRRASRSPATPTLRCQNVTRRTQPRPRRPPRPSSTPRLSTTTTLTAPSERPFQRRRPDSRPIGSRHTRCGSKPTPRRSTVGSTSLRPRLGGKTPGGSGATPSTVGAGRDHANPRECSGSGATPSKRESRYPVDSGAVYPVGDSAARVYGPIGAATPPGPFLPCWFRPVASSASRTMRPDYDRDRGSIETNFARLAPLELNGLPEDHDDADDGGDALTARTLLGSFSMSRRLGLIDLKVLAFAIERWRESGGRTASDSISFTLYKLGQAIYGHAPSGEERRLLRESIVRLFKVELNACGADARRPGQPVRVIARDGRLFTQQETLWDDTPRSARSPPAAGTPYRVGWPVARRQLRSGNVTYLHFPTDARPRRPRASPVGLPAGRSRSPSMSTAPPSASPPRPSSVTSLRHARTSRVPPTRARRCDTQRSASRPSTRATTRSCPCATTTRAGGCTPPALRVPCSRRGAPSRRPWPLILSAEPAQTRRHESPAGTGLSEGHIERRSDGRKKRLSHYGRAYPRPGRKHSPAASATSTCADRARRRRAPCRPSRSRVASARTPCARRRLAARRARPRALAMLLPPPPAPTAPTDRR